MGMQNLILIQKPCLDVRNNTKGHMRKVLICHSVVFILSAVIVSTTFAVPPPSAGSILSEERQERAGNKIQGMSPTPPEEEKPAAEETAESKVKVFVKRIEFTGQESLVAIKELNRLSAPYVGKESSLTELQRLAQKITMYLREKKGFLLTRAYLPEQDVTEGVVKITIIPGRLDGKVTVAIKEPYRVNKRLLDKMASSALPDEATILLKNMERTVLLINNLPGVSARAYLDKGKDPGTTRVSIDCTEGKLFSGTIYGDNFGNASTGAFRRAAQVSLSDPLHCGDMLQMTYLNSNYLNQAFGVFSFPLGAQGLFVDASANGLHYKLAGKLKNLDANGNAFTNSVNMRYPLVLSRRSSVWLGGGCDYMFMEDRIGSTVYNDRSIWAGNATITGNMYDDFFGGGLTFFSVSLNGGGVGIGKGKIYDEIGAKTNGGYFRATYLAARLQKVTKDISALVSMRGQGSSNNLDSSQKFILGGPTGVRAYPVGEAAGDEGVMLTGETRLDLPFMPSWMKTQLIGFYDAGFVRLHKDIWPGSIATISGRNEYWISGPGAGINIEKKGLYRAQFSYAFKAGKNPGADMQCNDADNEHNKGQFWVQGTVWF